MNLNQLYDIIFINKNLDITPIGIDSPSIVTSYDFLYNLSLHNKFLAINYVIRDLPQISVANPLEKINWDNIYKHTKNNLELLALKLNIKWKYVIKYNANEKKGYLFYGFCQNTNQLINYHRKESGGSGAGQTFIHVGTKDLQVSHLISYINYDKTSVDSNFGSFISILYDKTKANCFMKFKLENI